MSSVHNTSDGRATKTRRVSIQADPNAAGYTARHGRRRSSLSNRFSFSRQRSSLRSGFNEDGSEMMSSFHRKIALEPTYKMAPDKPFRSSTVTSIIRSTLESQLNGETYSADRCRQICETLATIIRDRVKEEGYHRYKIVAHVTMGPMSGQTIRVASRCLWNHQLDSYASSVFQNRSLYAVGTVFGIYYD
ncbi:dynein light chain Tctex-type 5-like [Corticium candelabrum]|uniref:dynein light chain Tctex-type 5-like n=1 Tax=Corticium candelabrum TaxID=121492 RepID=UPI002E25B856|nr:dynein light chain Tctex-type 5-like [Corticium candelabrum]